MTAPHSSNSYPRHMRDRSSWLPPGGIGSGLDAQTWAVLVDSDASQLILLLDELREAGIAAYAARVDSSDSVRITGPSAPPPWYYRPRVVQGLPFPDVSAGNPKASPGSTREHHRERDQPAAL